MTLTAAHAILPGDRSGIVDMLLNDACFEVLRTAAIAAPVDGVGFRVLIGMLANVDGNHWLKHGELVSTAGLEKLASLSLVSMSMVSRTCRRLEAMGYLVRLTPPHQRNRLVLYRVNLTPHVPLLWSHKMQQAIRSKNRLDDLARGQNRQRQETLDDLNGHVADIAHELGNGLGKDERE